MAIAFVQEVGKHNTAGAMSSIPIPVGVNTTAGNTLILRWAANTDVTGVADSRSNTWSIDVDVHVNQYTVIASCTLSTALQAGDTITVTLASATSYHGGVVDEFSGIDDFGVGSAVYLPGGNSTTRTANSVAVGDGALVIGFWNVINGSDATFAADTGWTPFNTATYAQSGGLRTLEGIYGVKTAATYTPTGTGGNYNYRGVSAGYSAAATAHERQAQIGASGYVESSASERLARSAAFAATATVAATGERSGAYSTAVVADGASCYLKLDETSGSTAEDSIGAADFAYTNTPTLGATGLITGSGTAVTLNGTDECLAVYGPSEVNVGDKFSFECWLKRDGTGERFIWGWDWYGGHSIKFNSGDAIEFAKAGYGTIATSTSTVTDTATHHLVVTKDGSTVKIWLDGNDVTGTVTNQTFGSVSGWTGVGYLAGQTYYKGTLDEIAWYKNVALTSEQVSNHYALGTGEALVVSRSAAVSATAAIASAAIEILERSAAISATTAIAVVGLEELARSAALAAMATVATAGHAIIERSGALTATGAVSVSATEAIARSVTLTATSGIATDFDRGLIRSAALAATTSVSATGEVSGIVERGGSLTATTQIASAPRREIVRSAALIAAASVATASRRELYRSATFAATGAITVTSGGAAVERSAAVGSATSIIASGGVIVGRSAALSAQADTVVQAFGRELARRAQIGATSALSAGGEATVGRGVALDAVSAVAVQSFTRDLLRGAGVGATTTIAASAVNAGLEAPAALTITTSATGAALTSSAVTAGVTSDAILAELEAGATEIDVATDAVEIELTTTSH